MCSIDVLIPTHNRPRLFQRCLRSVLGIAPSGVKVIVNNDTHDVESAGCEMHYNRFNSLTEIYAFLAGQSEAEYIYFLEDDDVLGKGFFNAFSDAEKTDLILGGYITTDFPAYTHNPYVFDLDFENFQLGQVIFKRQLFLSCLADTWSDRCNGNCIHTDYYIYLQARKRGTATYTGRIFYRQTADGRDNLSFPEFTDLSKCKNCDVPHILS